MFKVGKNSKHIIRQVFISLVIWIMILHGSTFQSFSQYFSGSTMGSYSGVNNTMVNPALLSNSRYYLDVNIVSGGSFIHNNYAYLAKEDYSVTKFFNPGFEFSMHDKAYGQGERPAYTVENKRPKDFFVNGRIMGPSVMVSVNDHSFALQTNFRSVNSMRDIPYDMANYFYYSLDYEPQHGYEYEHRDPIKFGTLAWSEIGLSWAYMFGKYDRDRWSFGVTAKLLLGHAGSYVYIDNMTYFVPDDDNIYVRNIDGEAGYALPVDYATNAYNGTKINGIGLGVDLGVSYTKTYKGHSNLKYKRLCQQRFEPYKYRIGVSLMDFGYIRFNDNARKYEYHNESGYWQEVDTLKPYYDNLAFISEDVSERFCGSEDCALTDDRITMYLPATLGIQADYHYTNNWYISGSLRIPINYAKSQVQAPWSVMVAPRIETQIFEIGTPITLYDMRYPMVGAYLRFYNFTIGTDNLGGFLNVTNHYGFDFYFSFKINFIKNHCKRKMPRFCVDNFRFDKSRL